MPLFHTASLNGLFDNLALGMRYILIPNFSPTNLLQAVQEYKVNRNHLLKHVTYQLQITLLGKLHRHDSNGSRFPCQTAR